MEDRRLWDKLTEGGRRLAVQADLELRRRHPDRKIRPLESAEPKVPDEPLAQPGWLTELDEQRRVFREELEARQNVMIPPEDPDWEDEGPAWQRMASPARRDPATTQTRDTARRRRTGRPSPRTHRRPSRKGCKTHPA